MRLPGAAVAVALFIMGAHAQAQQTEVKRGEYLIHAGGCIDCHTEDSDEASALTGGRAIESPFGTFFSPNITPEKFAEAVARAEKAMAALGEAASDNDVEAMGRAFRNVGEACKGCHERYREEHDH